MTEIYQPTPRREGLLRRLPTITFLLIAEIFHETLLSWANTPWKANLIVGLLVLFLLDLLLFIRVTIKSIATRLTYQIKKSKLLNTKTNIAAAESPSNDKPISSLTDDQLGYAKYAYILAKEIAHCDTPMTFGIHGKWGIGKTSLAYMIREFLQPRDTEKWSRNFKLRQIQEELRSNGHELNKFLPNALLSNFVIIDFNAWQYASAQALWRALILRLSRELEIRGLSEGPNEWQQKLYYSISQEQKGEAQLNSATLNIAALQAILTFLIYLLLPSTWVVLILGAIGIVKKGEFNLIGFSDLFEQQKFSMMRKQMESVEEFQSAFKQLVDKLLERKEAEPDKQRRLIIFFDDLDRCLPEVALEIMETTKTLMDTAGCIYILLCDQELIGQGVKAKFKERFSDAEVTYQKRGQEYIEKIIQVSFNIPPINSKTLKSYIEQALHKDNMPYFDIVHATVGNNPRKIKRLSRGLELAFDVMELALGRVHLNTKSSEINTYPAHQPAVQPRTKDSNERKREYAKVYCLIYGWPEAYTILNNMVSWDKNKPEYLSELDEKVGPSVVRQEALKRVESVLENTDLKTFGKFLITVDWEKSDTVGNIAISKINPDFWRYLRTPPLFSEMEKSDLQNYIEWSTVIKSDGSRLSSELAETPVEALDLSVQVFHSLKRTGISTVGDVRELLEKGESAVMSIRNFGEKSLDELRDKMREKGFLKDQNSEGKE